MSNSNLPFLIVEPNDEVTVPYIYFETIFSAEVPVTRVTSIEKGILELHEHSFRGVFLSTSFSPHRTLQFLESFKNSLDTELVPLIYVIDWTERIHRILGTTWGSKVGVLHSLSSKEEVIASFRRLQILP